MVPSWVVKRKFRFYRNSENWNCVKFLRVFALIAFGINGVNTIIKNVLNRFFSNSEHTLAMRVPLFYWFVKFMGQRSRSQMGFGVNDMSGVDTGDICCRGWQHIRVYTQNLSKFFMTKWTYISITTCPVKCKMKLLIHFQTSAVASLKFGNW